MKDNVYLKRLVEEIHSATVATIGADGHPQTRVIDMMLWDDKGKRILQADHGAAVCSSFCNEGQDGCFIAGQGEKYWRGQTGRDF